MSFQHPIIRPAEDHEIQQSPVRDDQALGDDEDLDRAPDGVPHSVIGYTALFSVFLAMLVAFMFITGRAGHYAAIALAVLAVPVLVSTLRKKAARDRDHIHPSR